jgi:hypothetical protein
MKYNYIYLILLLPFIGCEKDKTDELPGNIVQIYPVENIVDSLKLIFSENGNVQFNNPSLFSDTAQKSIVLDKESNVYVTFLDEATAAKNTLCWYSYSKSQPPLGFDDIIGNVIFPNISKTGEGGLLELGYTVQLGTKKFAAGTVIGFFLIASGWNAGAINYNANTYYTNYNFNSHGEQMHILFKNSYSKYLVVGFEDNLAGPSDFNDILFAVSDNNEGHEATSFDLKRVCVK